MAGRQPWGRAVLLDVDGTVIDALANQRRVWAQWAAFYGLNPEHVYDVALRTRPQETFAVVAGAHDPQDCLARLHALEDEDARTGSYTAFPGAAALLRALPAGMWALVTSNYEHRVRLRFARTGLPVPDVIVDAPAAAHGKPHPAPYLLAAHRLGVQPAQCLVIEDTAAGARAGAAAGMAVWTVNTTIDVPEAERQYPTLAAAAPDVLDYVGADHRAVSSCVEPPAGP